MGTLSNGLSARFIQSTIAQQILACSPVNACASFTGHQDRGF